MKTTRVIESLAILVLVSFCLVPLVARAQRLDLSDESVRATFVNTLASKRREAKAYAETWAQTKGIPTQFERGDISYELMSIENGRPLYYRTLNYYAAVSTAADRVRKTHILQDGIVPFRYTVDGHGLTIGLWDKGLPYRIHEQFADFPWVESRVTHKDFFVVSGFAYVDVLSHATHVACTIGGSGYGHLGAIGMAPRVGIDAYDWQEDSAEMAQRGAASPGEVGKIYISNHSYGPPCGWERNPEKGGYEWYGSVGRLSDVNADSVADRFGRYIDQTREFDEVAYNAPYYLVFSAAGNDRDDNPVRYETVYIAQIVRDEGYRWVEDIYDRDAFPAGDGMAKGGYDTINPLACAKNTMTVGAVDDAWDISRNMEIRSVSNADMTDFSGWGPTDDGRIKPDIVANGQELFSASATDLSTYEYQSGTSQACANASGSAVLLIDLYQQRFPGQAMRSSTLKGLIIHTADDMGRSGPDYQYGWGLMNTKAAADLIHAQAEESAGTYILEKKLEATQNSHAFKFEVYGTEPIRITLCWTDPPGNATSKLDDPDSRLVHPLNLIVFGPDSSTFWPFVLDPNNPSVAATTGHNTRDNVEQVYLEDPQAGVYYVHINRGGFNGAISSSDVWEQTYSLISDAPLAIIAPAPDPDAQIDAPVRPKW